MDVFYPCFLFRSFERHGGGRSPGAAIDSAAEEKQTPGEERHILCRQCRRRITRPQERIEVQGGHEHTFANPAGILYEIGCFRSAEGVGYASRPVAQWSWFKGFSWRIVVCSACLTHLGWMFLASDRDSFYGLILNRLIHPE